MTIVRYVIMMFSTTVIIINSIKMKIIIIVKNIMRKVIMHDAHV